MFIFTNYIDSITKKYSTFEGRATRSEFWYYTLLSNIIYIALLFVSSIATLIQASLNIDFLSSLVSTFTLVWLIGTIIPGMALTCRRLHDTDKSGWLQLLILIPLIGPIVLIVFFASAGTEKENRFGPNPKPAPKL